MKNPTENMIEYKYKTISISHLDELQEDIASLMLKIIKIQADQIRYKGGE